MPQSKSNTPRQPRRKKNSPSKTTRTLRFPLTDVLRDLRRAKLRAALREAAALAIEANITRERVLNDLDDLLVATAMDAFDGDVHMSALLLEVEEKFVRTRWNGLMAERA
jgi:hypothetical protein